MTRFSNPAQARRAAAEQVGERGGDRAYRQFREAAPHPTAQRKPTHTGLQVRAAEETRNGKSMLHTFGYFTKYERAYPMYDKFGEYEEMTMRGSGAKTLASSPDVSFLVNHTGVTMARSRGRDATLILKEDDQGGYHDAWLNLERQDVQILKSAIGDDLITEMSFAFMIPEGGGLWDEDFTTFQIRAYDINRGDVSAVNYGASHHTDIAARAATILDEIEHLPEGAREEAARRLSVAGIESRTSARERIEVTSRGVDRSASPHVRRLQWRTANTARRMAELAAVTGLSVGELVDVQLPWYEIRSAPADPAEDGTTQEVTDATDILIYDEIGGSFGVSAKRFAVDLAAIETPQINLRINSPGGSVFDALAIASSLRHKRDDGFQVRAYVDGLSASAATIVAIGAGEVVGMPGSEFMIHRASTDMSANEQEAEQIAIFLRQQDVNIARMYADKAGGDPAAWLDMMRAETWFLVDEAIESGLVDRAWSSATKVRGERVATDPRLTRKWLGAELPYRYEGRAGAPVTQNRRAFLGEGSEDARRVIQAAVDDYETRPSEQAEPVPAELVQPDTMTVPDDPAEVSISNGSIGGRPGGRNIATIQAIFAADGGELDL
jgi:ATP-dependent protease ClpP protease subunit/phage head maturation protease